MAAVCAVLASAGVVVWAVEAGRGGYDPRSVAGYGLGIGAAVALLVVMAYSARRAVPSVRALGPVRPYLRLHLYGGGLFAVLFLVHTGFSLPAGVLMWFLWGSAVWVVVTGLLGTLLQRYVPQVLDDASSLEVHYDRLPELVDELRTRAEKAAAVSPGLLAFYRREIAPEMQRPRTVLRLRPGRTVAQTFRSNELEILRSTLDAEGREALDELREIHRAKADMDLHHTLQLVLRGWLVLHLPVALVLLVLVALHVFFVLYF